MSAPSPIHALSLLRPPYSEILPVPGGRAQLRTDGRRPGSALVWQLAGGTRSQDVPVVRRRPGGLALVVILPPTEELPSDASLAHLMASVRPQAILPHHQAVSIDDLTWVLRRPPADLGVEVTEYLAWRGIPLDRSTTQLVRQTVRLSSELRSVSSLARAVYLSRRALGRRFLSRGLPVPSHWLHFARLLRVSLRLQNTEESVLSIGYEFGYPDGFSLSNQMNRLVGYRPSDVRRFLGWEWILEGWLRREAELGTLAPELSQGVLKDGGEVPAPPGVRKAPERRRRGPLTQKAAG